MNKTTIALKKETANLLKTFGTKTESYDSIILKLIAISKRVGEVGRK